MFTFVVLDKNHIANLNCRFFWCVQKGKLVLGIVYFRVVFGFGGEKYNQCSPAQILLLTLYVFQMNVWFYSWFICQVNTSQRNTEMFRCIDLSHDMFNPVTLSRSLEITLLHVSFSCALNCQLLYSGPVWPTWSLCWTAHGSSGQWARMCRHGLRPQHGQDELR